jgi:hypothetical protein
MEADKREAGKNEVGSEPFASGAAVCRDAFSLKEYGDRLRNSRMTKGRKPQKNTAHSGIA